MYNKTNRFAHFAATVALLFIGAFPKNSGAQDQVSGSVISPDFFPPTSVWINTEYGVSMDNLIQKIGLVVITDESCVECGYYLHQLQHSLFTTPAVQILQVMKGEPGAPISRAHIIQYVQQNQYTHPIGVVPDFSGFKNATIDKAPYFLLYEKNAVPSLVGSGFDGFTKVMKRLDEIKQDRSLLETCANFQMKTVIEPRWWANPVIETPTFISEEEGGDALYVNDAAHTRLMVFDGDGNVTSMLGSTVPGYLEGNIYQCAFDHPHGMVHTNGKLYIADTYNNRLRVLDCASTEVTTLLGNGLLSFKKAKGIDSRYEPIGLPTDVAVLGNKIYVASAATNQIYEVSPGDGQAVVFCDLPINETALFRNEPVNLNSGNNELFVVMSDGGAFRIDRKGKIEPLVKNDTKKYASVCSWKGGIVAVTKDGKIYHGVKGVWTLLGENKSEKGAKNMLTLNHPTDATVRMGDLLITDTDNHFIRMVGSPEDKLMKNFWFKMSPELIGFEAAHTSGEIILMDSLFFGNETVKVNVLLDLAGYKLVKGGQNEVLVNDLSGSIVLDSEVVSKESFSLSIKPNNLDEDIYFEMYLTLEHPENPGLFIIKRAYLDFPVIKDEKAELIQEMIYAPNLLPN